MTPIFSIFPDLSGQADVPETKFPGQPYCNDLLEDTYSRDYTFKSCLVLLNAMAKIDSSLSKYVTEWNKN